jgi:hypothetical protein
MRKLLFILLISPLCTLADEGMWLPNLLKMLNEKELAAAGCKLTPEQIYSINKGSLKDAVVQFGGGCTGEVISGQGLILTNHHCGFSQIQSHSSLEKNYIRDGFWAKSQAEELSNPGLTVTFIKRIDDITAKVLSGISDSIKGTAREVLIQANVKKLEAELVEGTAYQAKIKSFFYGNEYYAFITETYRDIRLVGAPPESIGNFGHDEDNWIWPRHTGDFSIFRIYAGPDNKPADFSATNVPYKPEFFFPISLKGVKENDFTMVFGFPGRTQEYLSSFAVNQVLKLINPTRIEARKIRLDVWSGFMQRSELTKIKYASKYNRLSNYYKKWTGESKGLERANVLAKKITFEEKFSQWLNSNPVAMKKYGTVLPDLKKEYEANDKYALLNELFSEAASGIEIFNYANYFLPLAELSQSPNTTDDEFEAEKKRLKDGSKGWFKNYEAAADQEIAPKLLKIYFSQLPKDLIAGDELERILAKHNGNYQKLSNHLFENSALTSEEATQKLLDKLTKDNIMPLINDPAFNTWAYILSFNTQSVQDNYQRSTNRLADLNRIWMQAQRDFQKERKFYPDANSTLRLSFGKIKGYSPKNAVVYEPFTTAEGILEKSLDTNNLDYKVPNRLKELILKKDFGIYVVNGKLPVAFCASNHTTGGNSGSPVLNASGELIGTNFDRNWDGTMSDISYDPDRVRNIVVDVRYTLFIIDKYAGASHLLKEMKLVN